MRKFEQNIINLYSEKGLKWLNDLPKTIAELAKLLNLQNLKAVNNLSYNYVLTGTQVNRPIVLKLCPDQQSYLQEKLALQALSSQGCVQILSYDDPNCALLLEGLGLNLKQLYPIDNSFSLEIACQVIEKLRQPNTSLNPQSFAHVRSWLAILDRDWSQLSNYLEKARDLKNYLLATSTQSILLHGDLHHENILACGISTQQFKAIDPKGIMGEPEFEVGAFLRNPMPEIFAYPELKILTEQRIALFANKLNLDPIRIAQWNFVQAVMIACWFIQDGNDINDLNGYIEIANQILQPE